MLLRALLFLFLISNHLLKAEEQLYPIPFKEKLDLLDQYADSGQRAVSTSESLEVWQWPELDLPKLYMRYDSEKRAYLLLDQDKKELSKQYFIDLKITYHPKNKKFYLLYRSRTNKCLGIMDLEGKEILAAKYQFLEILPWGDKDGKASFLYSKKCSSNSFTKISELEGERKVFGTVDPESGKEEAESFFKVILLPRAERYFCATYLKGVGLKYALYSKELEPLTAAIFETRETFKRNWGFDDPEIFSETKEFGMARPLYYSVAVNQDRILLKNKGKMTLYSFDGKELISPQWDSLFWGPDTDLLLCKNKKDQGVGLLSMYGERILAPGYTQILFEKITNDLYAIARMKGSTNPIFALYNEKYQALTDFIFESRKVGVSNKRFDFNRLDYVEATSYQYHLDIDTLSLSPLLLLRQKDKASVYNRKGRQWIEPTWDSIHVLPKVSDHLLVQYEGYLGLIDREGKVVMKPQFESLEALDTAGTSFIAERDGDYLIVNQKGGKLKKSSFKSAYHCPSLNLLALSKNGKEYALFNQKLKRLSPYKFKATERIVVTFDPETFEEWQDTFYMKPGEMYFDSLYQTVILQTAKGQGLYSNKAKVIIPAKYQELSYFYNDEAQFYIVVEKVKEELALFDQSGKQYSDFIYDYISTFFTDNTIYGSKKDGGKDKDPLILLEED